MVQLRKRQGETLFTTAASLAITTMSAENELQIKAIIKDTLVATNVALVLDSVMLGHLIIGEVSIVTITGIGAETIRNQKETCLALVNRFRNSSHISAPFSPTPVPMPRASKISHPFESSWQR